MATRPRVVTNTRKRVGRKYPNKPKGKARYTRKRGFTIPLTERIRIASAWLEGGPDNSPPKLAARFNRGLETIYAIINAPAVTEVGKAMESKLVELAAEDVVERIHYEVKTKKSKAGAWIAMELAERWGGIAPKISRSMMLGGRLSPQQGQQEKPEEEQVKDWVMKLTEVTMERGRVFGMPMPELEEFKDEVEIEIPVKTRKKEQAE